MANTFSQDGSVYVVTETGTVAAFPCWIKGILWTGAAAGNTLTITNDHDDVLITLKWVAETIYLHELEIILGGGFKCSAIGGGTCLVYIGGPEA